MRPAQGHLNAQSMATRQAPWNLVFLGGCQRLAAWAHHGLTICPKAISQKHSPACAVDGGNPWRSAGTMVLWLGTENAGEPLPTFQRSPKAAYTGFWRRAVASEER